MNVTTYTRLPSGEVVSSTGVGAGEVRPGRWAWYDIELTDTENEARALLDMASALNLDPLAIHDAVNDIDLPKLDEFGGSLLLVLHGLRDDRVETYEVDCFITADVLVTVHRGESPALRAFGDQLVASPPLAAGQIDELLARVADVLCRRLLSIVHAFDDMADDLLGSAVAGDPALLPELVAVRRDISGIRRSMHPQLDALADVMASESPLIGDAGRRRFSDARDVALRVLNGIESARSVLSETLEAYRTAEARNETQVTKVLTIYAAIMLPLTLVVGFFGMNFPNLPLVHSRSGWWLVLFLCLVIATTSLGVFVSLGWITQPKGRSAGRALGDGLIEAARTPVHVAGALYEVVRTPLRHRR